MNQWIDCCLINCNSILLHAAYNLNLFDSLINLCAVHDNNVNSDFWEQRIDINQGKHNENNT